MITVQDFHQRFRTNDQCLEYLFMVQYKAITCLKCNRENAYHRHRSKPCYTCNCGGSHIYPKKGTIYEGSPVDLSKWFFAIFLMAQTRNGVSAKELERQLGVTYPTAWRMAKKIRGVMPSASLFGKPEYLEAYLQNAILNGATEVQPRAPHVKVSKTASA